MAKKPKYWTVTVEPITGGVAGLIGYGGYLKSTGHRNHTKTTVIDLYGDFNNLVSKALLSALKIDEKNRKGGPRMSSLAMSYVFSLPPVFHPTPDQWKLITQDVIKAATLKLELPPSKWQDFIFTNLHDTDEKNSHFNMVISKTFEGIILEKVDQKALIDLTKRVFTQSVATHCQIFTEDYEIVTEKPKTRSGRTPKWELNRQLALDAQAKNAEVLAKIELDKEKVELAKIELANLLLNADNWIKAVRRKTRKEEEYELKVIQSYELLANLNVDAINKRTENIIEVAEETAEKKIRFKV